MTNKPKPDEEQRKAFVDAAHELGTNDDPAGFDRMLKKITKAPPPKTVQKRKRKKR
jgi:hypothetical protein